MNLFSHMRSSWEFWLQSPNAVRLSSTLLHFVWQGALLGGAASVLLIMLQRARPQVRYGLLLTILAAMTACPIATWFVVPAYGGLASSEPSQLSDHFPGTVREAGPYSTLNGPSDQKSDHRSTRSLAVSPMPDRAAASVKSDAIPSAWSNFGELTGRWLRPYCSSIVTAWLFGVLLLVLRLAAGLVGAEQTRRRGLKPATESVQQSVLQVAERLGIRRAVRIFESSLAATPTVVGWLAPVILLPTSTLCGLTPLQLRAILAHELAHVRRHDYLVNLAQTVVEIVLFYHPAVWWVSRRIRQEREQCCDDVAIDLCGDPVAYARALALLEEQRAAPRLALAASGAPLTSRVRRIVGRPEPVGSGVLSLAAVAVAMLLVLGSFCRFRPAAASLVASTETSSQKRDTALDRKAGEYTFHVVTTRGKPIAGALVRAWAVSAGGGSSRITEATSKAVKTDSGGTAQLVFAVDGNSPEALRMRADLKQGIRAVAITVDHPEHPVWSGYVDVDGKRRVVLSDSTTIEIRAHRGADKTPFSRLFPVLSRSVMDGADWTEQNGVVTIRRVDLDGEKASRWLRLAHVPESGPVLFSDLVDLKLRSEKHISLNLALKPSVRVEGELARTVPRPVKNGRVFAEIIDGHDAWTNWWWCATAEVGADGRFVLDSLPADENLQLIALCDGWSSASPTVAEASAYSAENGFSVLNYHGPRANTVFPRLVRLTGSTVHATVPMLRTATCEVTVVDEDGQPLSGASVEFWPGEMVYNHASFILGTGIDCLDVVRRQLASGKHRTASDPRPLSRHFQSYAAKTNTRGLAIVSNLALGGATEPNTPTPVPFDVSLDGYAPPGGLLNQNAGTVKLTAAQTGSVTVRLKKQ
jgi:beta-lactamase regulating signal transducer with metallopeptidase domain